MFKTYFFTLIKKFDKTIIITIFIDNVLYNDWLLKIILFDIDSKTIYNKNKKKCKKENI